MGIYISFIVENSKCSMMVFDLHLKRPACFWKAHLQSRWQRLLLLRVCFSARRAAPVTPRVEVGALLTSPLAAGASTAQLEYRAAATPCGVPATLAASLGAPLSFCSPPRALVAVCCCCDPARWLLFSLVAYRTGSFCCNLFSGRPCGAGADPR